MATTKKAPVKSKKSATAKPVMGSDAAARPAAKPLPKPVKATKGIKKNIMQVDPLFLYDLRVYTGTAWTKLGEIWFDTAGTEYWGLFQDWAIYNVGPNCWIYPIAYATAYSSLTEFKAKLTIQDPNHNPSFLKITQTPA